MLKNKVLYILEQQKGNVVKGGTLASSLGVSRTAVWKAVRALQEEGNEIVSIPNSGYRLMDTNDTLSEEIIHDYLTTSFLGRSLTLLATVNSTNLYLKEKDTSETPDGYVVIADEQTGGRGRKSRSFASSKGAGIYLSILLKLEGRTNDIRKLTVCTAVAVSKAIEKVCGMRADIKWVNDVFCNGKKICGILTEAVLSGELHELSTIIVGIGINTGSVPPEISEIATSVQEESGLRGVRNRLTAEVLNQFELVYLDYLANEMEGILSYYESRLFIIGKEVYASGVNGGCNVTVVGIDDEGALIVKEIGGDIKHIITGEIKIKGEGL